MDYMWYSVIAGAVIGVILSAIFGIYETSSAVSFSRTIFGMSTNDLIFNSILTFVVGGFVFLAAISVVVFDKEYPVMHPGSFTSEVLLMAFLPACVFLIMAPLRGKVINLGTMEEFGVLVAKFGLLHVLLQFSGFYSSIFPPQS